MKKYILTKETIIHNGRLLHRIKALRTIIGGPDKGTLGGFVDLATGDIYKPASWKAPAKHARGNIYQPETWVTVTSYGPAYLK